mmetsp:Transcript_13457/g.35050  ORF Transcript_13457/g.35050 Transcript_13457/m.35050 type:complete len:222 (+) Transcript_13457:1296-1961(+)
MYTRLVLGGGHSEPYSCTYMAKKHTSCPFCCWKASTHLERYGNSAGYAVPSARVCACAAICSFTDSFTFSAFSTHETTRTITGDAVTPAAVSSVATYSSSTLDSAVCGKASAPGTTSSSGRERRRFLRQASQYHSVSSGVSSPLKRAHTQWCQPWHSSHCTQLSTNSGRSFSLRSMKKDRSTGRPTRSCIAPAGSAWLRISAKHRLHSLTLGVSSSRASSQ